ncbi:MAG: hypothetical protein V7K69_06495 [Nostoc sp.]
MSEPATVELIANGISEDKVIFPPGDILSNEPPLEPVKKQLLHVEV